LAFTTDASLPRPVICLPERPFASIEDLAQVVARRVDADGYVVMVVPETMKWTNGESVAGDEPVWIDTFGHRYYPSAGEALARELRSILDLRARYDKPGTIARMSMLAASPVDIDEAFACGCEAVRRALAGESGTMVTIERTSDSPYAVRYSSAPLERIANTERRLPAEYIALGEHDVTHDFSHYATPLLGVSLEPYEVLD
jgi:6-phosphofructokinase 1